MRNLAFMDENFMLNNEPAKKIYNVAKQQPIHDFHCHLDPQEIYEDKPYDNIVDIWLGGDHYKWRLMRANGVAERYITGDASNEEKFEAWARTVGKAIGNQLFHWTNLEMKMYFGIDEYLNENNWRELYDRMNKHIQDTNMSPRKLINDSNVKFIGTTDHPLDSLEWHEKIKEDDSFDVTVAPTFRPDEAFVSHSNFSHFVSKLADISEVKVNDFDSFVRALETRVKYFADKGARASDHSLAEIVFEPASKDELNEIFNKAVNGQELTQLEEYKWQTEAFGELNRLYKENGLVSQVHFGALRNNNSRIYEQVGADAGVDSMGTQVELAENLNKFLDYLTVSDNLPKMVWYNLNPVHNTVLANTLQNFQANDKGIQSQLQFGAAWWFNDTKLGMRDQMHITADQGLLPNFIGMLTDSRSFLSFARHDYFRRILADFLGEWVETEEIPNDDQLLTKVAEDISFKNANNFFQGVNN